MESLAVTGLASATSYFFILRSEDEVPNPSAPSNPAEAATAAVDQLPPRRVTDLVVTRTMEDAIEVAWTAPGDDSVFGRATGYEIRYAREPITASTWRDAFVFSAPPAPQPAGSTQRVEVTGLIHGTEYNIALVASDEAGNVSGLSNSGVGRTGGPVPRVWAVKVDGSGDGPTVQAAIDSAATGDTVLVWPGKYYENIDFMGKDIVVKSRGGPEATILDGSRKVPASVVVFRNGETRAAVIEGFTITGGTGTGPTDVRGGGIYCLESSPTVRFNWIRGNSAVLNGNGGGMRSASGDGLVKIPSPLVEGNLFEDNVATVNGGGLALGRTEGIVRNNVFRRNRTLRGDGGGAWVWVPNGVVVLEGNEFWENFAVDHGGGLYVANTNHADDFEIINNLFVRNRADGPGVDDTGSGGGLALLLLSKGTIRNNTFVDNVGFGESPCSGGSLLLYQNSTVDVIVSRNIFVGSVGCAIACYRTRGTVFSNLFWNNDVNIGSQPPAQCPEEWISSSIFADPLFCGSEDYRVAANSPAVSGEEVMGAFGQPGCPNRAAEELSVKAGAR